MLLGSGEMKNLLDVLEMALFRVFYRLVMRHYAFRDTRHVIKYTSSRDRDVCRRRSRDLYATRTAKRFPTDIAWWAAKKLEYVDLASSLEDLRNPPGNRLCSGRA